MEPFVEELEAVVYFSRATMRRNGSRRKARPSDHLPIEEILTDFQRSEESTAHRKGTFKIDIPFEDALKVVAHAKLGPRKARHPKV